MSDAEKPRLTFAVIGEMEVDGETKIGVFLKAGTLRDVRSVAHLFGEDVAMIRADLAPDAAKVAALAVKVKPLVWQYVSRTQTWQAKSPFGYYEVGFDDGWWAQLEGHDCWYWEAPDDPRCYEGPTAGMLACEADYQARVFPVLDLTPDPRVAAMVEAARALLDSVDAWAETVPGSDEETASTGPISEAAEFARAALAAMEAGNG